MIGVSLLAPAIMALAVVGRPAPMSLAIVRLEGLPD
jgi:hypothetical protein